MTHERDELLARARELQAARRGLMEELVDLRDHHGLTQQEVADRMGVSQSAVAQFERYDANPTLGTIQRYALAVEASLDLRVKSTRSRERELSAAPFPNVLVMRMNSSRRDPIDWGAKKVTHAGAR